MYTRSYRQARLTAACVLSLAVIAPGAALASEHDLTAWSYLKVWMKAGELASANAFKAERDDKGKVHSTGSPFPGAVSVVGDQVVANVPMPQCPARTGSFRRYEAYGYSYDAIEGSTRVATIRIPIAKADELAKDGKCGGANTGGMLSVGRRMRVVVYCEGGEPSYSGPQHFRTELNIEIGCDPAYKSPATVPYGWRHTCPAGYVVKGTGKQEYDAATPNVVCISANQDRLAPPLTLRPALATQPGGLCSRPTRVEPTPTRNMPTTTMPTNVRRTR